MTGILDGLSERDVQRVRAAGTVVRLPPDWSPIQEQTPADKAYILLSGEVSVRRGGTEIARLGPGEVFGEAGLVTHRLRNASVVTTTPVQAVHLTAEQLDRLCTELPAFRAALERSVRARLDD